MMFSVSVIVLVVSVIICLWDWLVASKVRHQHVNQHVHDAFSAKETIDEDLITEQLKPSGLIQTVQLLLALSALIVFVDILGIETLLVLAVFVAFIFWIGYHFWFARCKKRQAIQLGRNKQALQPDDFSQYTIEQKVVWYKRKLHVETVAQTLDSLRTTFLILLVVVLLRSFLYEPFRIPSGSLEPTLKVGDFILVNKYDYGLRLPVINKKIIKVGEPKVGDIAVFHWPANPKIDYIKRVIGVPGDTISYINKELYINGKPAPQKLIGNAIDTNGFGHYWQVLVKQEDLLGIKHGIYLRSTVKAQNFNKLIVPKGYYFMMGDNRDDSLDSRYWGFVPEKNIVGKAVLVWLSWRGIRSWDWNGISHAIRWQRIFKTI